MGVYDVDGRCGCVGGERPLWDGLGIVECRIIDDLVNSFDINLCTGCFVNVLEGYTFGISDFLIGMYRFGMSDRALRTVRRRARAISPDNTPSPLAMTCKVLP